MKRVSIKVRPDGVNLRAAALGCLFGLALCAFSAQADALALQGKYTVLAGKTAPAPHTLDVVVVEEFLNFSCPHCNAFREVAKPVFAKYGKRLKLVRIPVLFRGQGDAPLRLFYVAQAHDREDEIDEALFDARFRNDVDNFSPDIVSYLARSNGLEKAYEKEASLPWVDHRIADGMVQADAAGVDATPTLLVEGVLKLVPQSTMADFVANFDNVVAQLLKKPEK